MALVPASIPPLILVGEADFNPGVVGLAAGKLAEQFGAPAAVYAMDGDRVMASCRSAPGFHWADALTRCGDLLIRYGGHAQAAGFACDAGVLPELNERLTSIAAEQLGEARPLSEGVVDAEAQPGELMGRTFQALRRLEPHGVGNPAPIFMARGIEVVRASTMGADGKHFRLTVRSGGALWDIVAFQAELARRDQARRYRLRDRSRPLERTAASAPHPPGLRADGPAAPGALAPLTKRQRPP